MNLKKKIGKLFTSKFIGTGPSSYKQRIYWAAVLQRLRNTILDKAVASCLVMKIPTFLEARQFIAVFTKSRLLTIMSYLSFHTVFL